jgi:glycosyltransferase involved in cell wall biosynthesis
MLESAQPDFWSPSGVEGPEKISDMSRLSICIPTYNRANLLEATILRVIDQVGGLAYDGRVEILIGDNASTDATETVGRKFSDSYPYVKYHRNKENIGGERNWLNLSKLAAGSFFWVLADDDYIHPGVLQRIISNLEGRELGLVYINYSIWSDDLDAYEGPSRCEACADGFVEDRRQFYSEVRFANSFISSVAFNRQLFDQHRSEIEGYSGNAWLQLYAADILLRNRGAMVITEPMIKKRSPEVRSLRARARAQGAHHFFMTAHLQFLEFASGLKKEGMDVLDGHEMTAGNLYQIVVEKMTSDRYDLSYWMGVLRRMLAATVLNKGPSFWLGHIPMILLPNSFSRVVYEWWSFKGKMVGVVAGFSESSNPFEKAVHQCLIIYRSLKKEFQRSS